MPKAAQAASRNEPVTVMVFGSTSTSTVIIDVSGLNRLDHALEYRHHCSLGGVRRYGNRVVLLGQRQLVGGPLNAEGTFRHDLCDRRVGRGRVRR